MQGSFSVWTDHKRGHAKVKDLARFKPMQRHLFLHEKAVIFCKRREENGEGYEKAPSYSYKQSLNVSVRPGPRRPSRSSPDAHPWGEGCLGWRPTVLSLLPQMTAVGITENVKGDARKFEIWYNAREEVYIVQVGLALRARPWGPSGPLQIPGV